MMSYTDGHESQTDALQQPTELRTCVPPTCGAADDALASTIADLEDRVRCLIGTEPKDYAHASILLYDILRRRGEIDGARALVGVFDLPAMVLYQTLLLVGTVAAMDGTATPGGINPALNRIDDHIRLLTLALDGDTTAEILRRVLDLRTAVARSGVHPEHTSAVIRAGERLTHLVNAFFFDRLIAVPALRNYIVGLELGY